MKTKHLFVICTILLSFILIYSFIKIRASSTQKTPLTTSETPKVTEPSPTSTPTPTPKPLTFAEMNAKYGPCVKLPVLMYHHIQDPTNQTSPSVDPDYFSSQMEYLQTNGYTSVSSQQIIDFFNSNTPLPVKPVMITFDDGYVDFAENAIPILNQLGHKATMFLSTGLIGNPDYLSWDQVSSINSSNITFGNHTWSHKNTQVNDETLQAEIGVAQTQLTERGLGNPKIFAYPYGIVSRGINYLQTNGFQLAFTTKPGSTLCSAQRFILPRIRIGNASPSEYGL